MGFRLVYKGAEVFADTAADVRDLIELFAAPVAPRLLLGAGEPPGAPAARPRRGRRRVAVAGSARRRPTPVRRRRAARMGGGVRRKAPATPAGPPALRGARGEALRAAVLEAVVRRRLSKPADITAAAGADKHAVRQVLKELVAAGALRAEGATLSRRYLPIDSRAAAKEGLR